MDKISIEIEYKCNMYFAIDYIMWNLCQKENSYLKKLIYHGKYTLEYRKHWFLIVLRKLISTMEMSVVIS